MAKEKKSGERYPVRDSAAFLALAFNIRMHREAKGWSQGELAAEVELTQDMISLIENRRANPTLVTIEQIADAYGVSVHDLFAPAPRQQGPKG